MSLAPSAEVTPFRKTVIKTGGPRFSPSGLRLSLYPPSRRRLVAYSPEGHCLRPRLLLIPSLGVLNGVRCFPGLSAAFGTLSGPAAFPVPAAALHRKSFLHRSAHNPLVLVRRRAMSGKPGKTPGPPPPPPIRVVASSKIPSKPGPEAGSNSKPVPFSVSHPCSIRQKCVIRSAAARPPLNQSTRSPKTILTRWNHWCRINRADCNRPLRTQQQPLAIHDFFQLIGFQIRTYHDRIPSKRRAHISPLIWSNGVLV